MAGCTIYCSILFLCSVDHMATQENEVQVSYFTEDPWCRQFEEREDREITRMDAKSRVDCVQKCAQSNLCDQVRISAEDLSCELAFSDISLPNVNNTTDPPNISSNKSKDTCYRLVISHSSNSTLRSDQQSTNETMGDVHSTLCNNDIKKELYKSNWTVMIEFAYEKGQTLAGAKENEFVNIQSKTIFRHPSLGDSFVMTHSFVNFKYERFKGALVNAIETSNLHFKPDAHLISYTCSYDAQLHETFIHVNGSSWVVSTKVSEMQILTENGNEYTLHVDSKNIDLASLIAWIRQGFKVHYYRYAVIWQDGQGVSLYKINDEFNSNTGARPHIPVTYRQHLMTFPGFHYVLKTELGISSKITLGKSQELKDIVLSSLWKELIDSQNELKDQISHHISYGHRFRAAFNNSFFDVDDVIKIDNDVYFILPQQIKSSSVKELTEDSVGVRAFLSVNGVYCWCSHSLGDEKVLQTAREKDQEVQIFVDQKAWKSVLSIYTNGTVACGSVDDLVQEAKAGKDFNILIQWLGDGKERLITVTLLKIKHFQLPDVMVIAESESTWNLVPGPDPELELSEGCHLEKLLVKSNGEVETLVYNTLTRYPSSIVDGIRTTWFAL